MCLFHFSACFEQPSAHHQKNQLYQYINWYISLGVGERLVCTLLKGVSDFTSALFMFVDKLYSYDTRYRKAPHNPTE